MLSMRHPISLSTNDRRNPCALLTILKLTFTASPPIFTRRMLLFCLIFCQKLPPVVVEEGGMHLLLLLPIDEQNED
jgi:hypothetical protein